MKDLSPPIINIFIGKIKILFIIKDSKNYFNSKSDKFRLKAANPFSLEYKMIEISLFKFYENKLMFESFYKIANEPVFIFIKFKF